MVGSEAHQGLVRPRVVVQDRDFDNGCVELDVSRVADIRLDLL